MARETSNWLSFSLSPMEMLSSSSQSQMLQSTMKLVPFDAPSTEDSHHYYFDNFYANGWENTKAECLYDDGENQVKQGQSIADSSIFRSFVDSQIQQNTVPKLEDFLGGESSSLIGYSDSQTETQEDSSSLTHIYGQNGSTAYFNDHHQDLKPIQAAVGVGGFQAFSANSGSEEVVDDSAFVGRAQLTCVNFGGRHHQSIESGGGNQLGFSQCPTVGAGALSLGVNSHSSSEKAIVSVDSSGTCKKITDTFGQRTSIYRGVTRHRWTGRYEAHLWDNSCRREGQARKGRQVYLGGYDKEDKAARAYDLAALKYWGPTATTNFPVSSYTTELDEMKHATKQEFIASLRRKSSGFSRGASIYRGVTRHHQQGRWQARIGRVAGNKDLYLGTFATEEEAAEAYDIAAIKFRGLNAVTNFEMNRYDVEAIMKSALPIGGAAKRLKLSLEAEQKPYVNHDQQPQCSNNSSTSINFSTIQPLPAIPCGGILPFDTTARYHHNLFNIHSDNDRGTCTSDNPPGSAAASMVTPMTFLPPPPAEFFIWPHQSY
ncbi:AP2-like ethylene-responsive transcription factor AIL6 [Camellia sinensis]|uniref:AP2-like ethylene-responsive transcription factor AIL6 n=1 Tax=Camellia sinensis TaxID=4442 RepID=UPI0010362CCB|nr:AP2-like ethylene-responsive transcription factor AIL6 [Camellia sinensis]